MLGKVDCGSFGNMLQQKTIFLMCTQSKFMYGDQALILTTFTIL